MESTWRIKKLIPHEGLIIMDPGTLIPVEDVVAAYESAESRRKLKKQYTA